MAYNKVIDKDENVLLDLTADTATESDVVLGKTFHDRSGTLCTGILNATLPQLHTPTLTINKNNRTVTITNPSTNGDYVTGYGIYLNNSLVATIQTTTYDFSSLLSEYGTYNFVVKAKGSSFTDSTASNEVTYVYADPSIVGTLEETSWAKIREICEAGLASGYWNVGDSKTVTGGDGYDRIVKIVDMQGLYGKHVVFQFMNTSNSIYSWECHQQNYLISNMNTVCFAENGNARQAMIGSDLEAQLTPTTVKAIESKNSTTLIDITNTLFLPAEKELCTSRSHSNVTEFNALTTFEYWQTHTSPTDKILTRPSDNKACSWWLRSIDIQQKEDVCVVSSYGGVGSSGGAGVYVAPCFAF